MYEAAVSMTLSATLYCMRKPCPRSISYCMILRVLVSDSAILLYEAAVYSSISHCIANDARVLTRQVPRVLMNDSPCIFQ